MENEDVAKVAIKALSGYILNGSRLSVEVSQFLFLLYQFFIISEYFMLLLPVYIQYVVFNSKMFSEWGTGPKWLSQWVRFIQNRRVVSWVGAGEVSIRSRRMHQT